MFLSTRYFYCTFWLLFSCLILTKPAAAQRLRDTKFEKGTLDKGQKTGVWEYYGYTRSGEKWWCSATTTIIGSSCTFGQGPM